MKALRAIVAILGLYLAPSGPENTLANAYRRAKLRQDDRAVSTIAGIGTAIMGIIVVIIVAVVGMRVIAALFPTYSGSVSNISENFTTADWGDTTANSISPIFALVVALVGLIALVGLVISTVSRD